MKTVLLTGSTGFLGKKIKNFLSDQGFLVVLAIRSIKKKSYRKRNFIFVKKPKSQKEFYSLFSKYKFEYVIHCAGYYVRNHQFSDIKKLIDCDINYLNNLLESMSKFECKKLITFGTYFQFFSNKNFSPKSLYAAYKQLMFTLSKYYYIKFNISHIQLILFDTYGLDDKRDKIIPTLINLNSLQEISLGNKQNLFFPLHIDDLLNGIKISMNLLDSKNKIYAQYSLKGYSTKLIELVNIIEKIRNLKLNIIWSKNKINSDKLINFQIKKLPKWTPQIKIKKGISSLLL